MRHHALFVIAALSGCVDGFQGSNIQFDFAQGTPVQAAPGATVKPSQLPANINLRLYAVDESATKNALFEIQRFEIHRVVDLSSPCYIDVGEHVPHPGLHVSQYAKTIQADDMIPDIANPPSSATTQQKIDVATAITRQNNVALLAADTGIAVVSSASSVTYPAMDADCTGTGIPAVTCTDEASNKRRLAQCQKIWASDPQFFEGTDRILVSPLAGTTYGMIDGLNPVNFGPVGGVQFFVPTNLDRFDTYAIYWQFDGMDGTGTLLYYGHHAHDAWRDPRAPRGRQQFFAHRRGRHLRRSRPGQRSVLRRQRCRSVPSSSSHRC